jgi:hypothetical protein
VRRPLSTYTLVATAWCLVALFCVALWIVPFARVRGAADRIARLLRSSAPADAAFAARVGRVVRFASRFVPAATCLPCALAALVLLRSRSVPARLRIGVARDGSGQLDGHAWVESNGRVVVGGLPNLGGYTTFETATGEIL